MDGGNSTEALKTKQRTEIRLGVIVPEGGGRAGARAYPRSPMM